MTAAARTTPRFLRWRRKGDALKTGLRYFQELPDRSEYNGIVTADADGQHSVADVTALCRAMRDETGLWLGVRDFSLDHVPAKSRFGNKLTRSIFHIFYHKYFYSATL